MKRTAFSLVELLVVLFVISTLAAVAIPRFGGSLLRYRLEKAAQRVADDLAAARQLAQARSASVTVAFDNAGDSYSIPAMSDPDHPNQSYLVKLRDAPFEVAVQNIAFGAKADITFDGYGMPDTAGTVTLRAGDSVKYIIVSGDTGAVSVNDSAIFTGGVGGSQTVPLSP